MNCPKCGSPNVSVQAVNTVKLKNRHHGFLWWLFIGWWWVPVKWVFFTLPALIIKIFRRKKQKAVNTQRTMAVCQACGHTWEAKPAGKTRAPSPQPAAEKASEWPRRVPLASLDIPAKIGEYKAKYVFRKVDAAFASNRYDPGTALELHADGNIFIEGNHAGTYENEKIRSMVADWNKRGEIFKASMYLMNEDGRGLFLVAFFQIPNYTKERICKVLGTGSESSQAELMSYSPGEELTLSEDFDHDDRVNVEDIGYLGKKDSEWVMEELNLNFCEVTVESVELDSSDKYVLRIKIRY